MANTKKYVSLDKLSLYDEKIKKVISDGDAASLQSAKDYADSLATNYDAAGAAGTVQGELDKEIARAKAAEEANAAAAKQAQDEVDALELVVDTKAAQADLEALDTYVGTIPEGATATNVVAYVQEKTAGIATSENLQELTNRVVQAETDIDNIEKDYLKAADKTELEGKITTAQGTAEAAQAHSEGVASDLAEAKEALEAADAGQVERIAVLEGQIVGLSGAMHFEGVKDAIPEDVTGYENGDVIIVGDKEYVFNGTEFVEFGDVSAQAEAITALTGRMDTAEGKITTLEGQMTAVEGAVATKVEQETYNAKVAELENADKGLSGRIATLEAAVGESGSVAEDISTAKQEAIDAAAAAADTKDTEILKQAKEYADGLDTAMGGRMDIVEAKAHEHANKALLDTYTQTEADLADAVAKKHEHANKTVLDGITAEKVAAWDSAEGNAKTYADGLNTAMDTRVTAVETWQTNFIEVSEEEINGLFA